MTTVAVSSKRRVSPSQKAAQTSHTVAHRLLWAALCVGCQGCTVAGPRAHPTVLCYSAHRYYSDASADHNTERNLQAQAQPVTEGPRGPHSKTYTLPALDLPAHTR